MTAMRYAFTGPSRTSEHDEQLVVATVAGLTDGTEFTTGAANGVDTVAAHACMAAWPDAYHRVVVPAAWHNRYVVDAMAALGATILRVPPHREPYRERNETMIGYADTLVAFLRKATFYRSGEWMTVNIARKQGVTVIPVVLGGILPS